MAEKLTLQQEQAINDRGGNLLVSAAAGSGKTKVLVDRLMRYLTDQTNPANIDDFLIITYTKAAASELRGKIAAKLSERIADDPQNRHLQKQMQRLFLTKISTVHGFCGDILRQYAYHLDLSSDFRVADENESQEIRNQVIKELLDSMYVHASEEPDFCAFVDSQGLGRDDRLVPEIVLKVYDSARCHLNPEEWLNRSLDIVSAKYQDVSETLWGEYLIKDLRDYLASQISVFEECVQQAECCDGWEKVVLNLKNTLLQLKQLHASERWDDIVASRTIDYGRLNFPRKNTDEILADRIRAARNACKKNLDKKLNAFTDNSDQIELDMQQTAAGIRGIVRLVDQFGKEYQKAKKIRKVLDFGDLEHKMLDLLLGKKRTGRTSAAAEIGGHYREIMVDEYQDSNQVQDAIFRVLSGERHNCFMVGDVKQSIYQFRLADPSIFLEKYNSYAYASCAQTGEGRKILLSHNFRSGAEVVEAVNDVFSACMTPKVGGLLYGEEEALREGIAHEALPDPAVELHVLDVREDTYREEAAFVAQKIQNMIADKTLIRDGDNMRPVTADDIVILLRSPGSVGKYYKQALEARGIACVSGGGTDLLKSEEVATFRSILQIVVNPRQDIPLISSIASPVFGFSADDLAMIRSKQKRGSLYDAIAASDHPKAADFLSIIQILRREAKMRTLTGFMESCLAITRIDSIYGAMPGGDARKANLHAFFQLAAEFEKNSLRDLNQFLDHLDALEDRGISGAGSASTSAVTLMSIHKSKGLEFPVVFLCGLARAFNKESQQAQVLCDKDLGVGLSVSDVKNRIRYPSIAKRAISVKMAAESLSEEMRVLYVAMTRARDRLIMLYSVKNPEADLADIAQRMDFDKGRLLCADAICPGDWVLLAAMQHIEAGELHACGGRPGKLSLGKYPWKICVSTAPEADSKKVSASTVENRLLPEVETTLRDSLQFCYPYEQATSAPSKQTATGRKGRIKDAEAAENTQQFHISAHKWRAASFFETQRDSKDLGNAIHAVMQFVRYECCSDIHSIQQEIKRMTQQGFIKQNHAEIVDCEKIAAFFNTETGRKLRSGTPYIREFKFSILDDGEKYGPGLAGEQVLLQGVVDCALLEKDGITILDFKTDYVTEETFTSCVEKYRTQLETYAEAMARIYQLPVKQKLLYFFRLNRFAQL